MDSFTHRGRFWLPGREADALAGDVSFSLNDGVRAELTGLLGRGFDEPGSYPVVHGVIQGGRPVSLLRAFTTNRVLGGVESQRLMASVLVEGAHTKGPEEQRFREIFIHAQLLPEWSEIVPLHHEVTLRGNRMIGIQTAYGFPPEVRGKAGSTFYGVGCGFSTEGDARHSWTIRTETGVRIRPARFQTLDELVSGPLVAFQQLLALSTDHACDLTGVHATMRAATHRRGRSWEFRRVGVFFQPRFHSGSPTTRLPIVNEFPVSFSDLGEDFAEALNTWERNREELDSIFGLFFSARYGDAMLLDQRFSYLIQAAEAYHRRRIGGGAIPEQDHSERVRTIIDAAPEEHTDWLGQRLEYSNEPSLRNRLKGLLDLVPGVGDHLVGSRTKFVQLALDTRNYYTHHDVRLRDRAASGRRLYALTETLRYLVSAVMMRELGLSDDVIHQHLTRSSGYQRQPSLIGRV